MLRPETQARLDREALVSVKNDDRDMRDDAVRGSAALLEALHKHHKDVARSNGLNWRRAISK